MDICNVFSWTQWLPCSFTGENGSREIDARKGGTSHSNGLVLDGEHTLSDPMLFGEEFAKQATTTSTTTVKQIKEMKKLNVPQEKKNFPGY